MDRARAAPAARALSRPRPLAVALLGVALGALTFALYHRTLGVGLLSDDWVLLYEYRDLASVFAINLHWYHYSPVSLTILWLTSTVAGLDPRPYHVVALALLWLNAMLTAALAWRLTRQRVVAVLAGIFFLTYGTQFEGAVWVSAAYLHGTATLIASLGLLAFIRWEQGTRRQKHLYGTYLAAVVLAPLAHEEAVTLVVISWLYHVVVHARHPRNTGSVRNELAQQLAVFAPPAALLGCFLTFKLWIASRAVVNTVPGLQGPTLPATLLSSPHVVLGCLLPGVSPAWLDHVWNMAGAHRLHMILTPAAIVLTLFLLWRLPPIYRFLFAWIAVDVVVTLVAIGLQSRHTYPVAVPVAIFWSAAIGSTGRRLTLPVGSGRIRPATSAVYLGMAVAACAFVLPGVRLMQQDQAAWATASDLARSIDRQIAQAVAVHPRARVLYLFGLTDSIRSSSYDEAYVYRNGEADRIGLEHRGNLASIVHLLCHADGRRKPGAGVIVMRQRLLAASHDRHALLLRHTGTGAGVQIAGMTANAVPGGVCVKRST